MNHVSAVQMFALLAAAAAGNQESKRILSISTLRHRGKGRGSALGRGYALTPIPKSLRDPDGAAFVARPVSRSKYEPHQGKRECARRAARLAS